MIAIAQLMVVLDGTVVTIALPSAQRDLGISNADRQWTITAYTVAFGGLLLLGGRIADYTGRKRSFLVGLLGFAAASALGGAAQNGTTLGRSGLGQCRQGRHHHTARRTSRRLTQREKQIARPVESYPVYPVPMLGTHAPQGTSYADTSRWRTAARWHPRSAGESAGQP